MKSESSLILFFILIFLCLALGAFAIEVHNLPHEYVYVDARQAFIYPEGAQFVLVLPQGEYTVSGYSLPSGCYELQPAGLFGGQGTAVWSNYDCPRKAAK